MVLLVSKLTRSGADCKVPSFLTPFLSPRCVLSASLDRSFFLWLVAAMPNRNKKDKFQKKLPPNISFVSKLFKCKFFCYYFTILRRAGILWNTSHLARCVIQRRCCLYSVYLCCWSPFTLLWSSVTHYRTSPSNTIRRSILSWTMRYSLHPVDWAGEPQVSTWHRIPKLRSEKKLTVVFNFWELFVAMIVSRIRTAIFPKIFIAKIRGIIGKNLCWN